MNCSRITIRRLAWGCGGLSAGIAAVQFLSGRTLVPVLLGVLCACVLGIVFSRGLWRLRAGIFALLFALGVLWSAGWSMRVAGPVLALDGQTVSAAGIALDAPRTSGNSVTLDIRFQLPELPAFTARVYDFEGFLPEVRAGDLLSGSFRFRRGDRLHGEEYSGYLSQGVILLADPAGELSAQPREDLRFLPRRLAKWVSGQVDALFPADVRAFEKALLTGDKQALYAGGSLYRALSHSGLSHMVAVSGMHVSFLVGLILLICSPRRAFIPGIPAVLLFMLMTGMTPSVVRAGILYLALLTAPLVKRESDGLTTLLLALALILLQNPAAVCSVGLQLSFASMAGILLLAQPMLRSMTGYIRKKLKNRRLRRMGAAAAATAAMSLSAAVGTVPLVALHFGYFPVYSLPANLLTQPVIALVFCMGYISCLLGAASPVLGTGAAWLTAWGLRFIQGCARLIAALPGSVLYTENPIFLQWLVFAGVLFLAAWLLRGREGFRPLFPGALAVLSLCACCLMVNLAAPRLAARITVMDVGQGQSILLLAGERAVVVDCGSGGTVENAGDTVGEYLLSRGVKRLDALILTHLHSDHAGGAALLLEQMNVDRLLLAPGLPDEDGLRDEILRIAEARGTEICMLNADSRLTAGEISLTVFAPPEAGTANERGLIISGGIRDFDLLITGDAGASTEHELVTTRTLPDTELLIVGHHGSKNSTSLELMEALRPDYAVISVGSNSYGHPTVEALQRAVGFGARLYRTDLNGNVTFYIGEDHG